MSDGENTKKAFWRSEHLSWALQNRYDLNVEGGGGPRISAAPEFQPLNKWSSRENTKLKESEEAH